MSNNQAANVLPSQPDVKVNLDHVQLHARHGAESCELPLNHYLSAEGRRSFIRTSADYDYPELRSDLHDRIGLFSEYPVKVDVPGAPLTFQDALTFNTALSAVQRGTARLGSDAHGLPVVPLVVGHGPPPVHFEEPEEDIYGVEEEDRSLISGTPAGQSTPKPDTRNPNPRRLVLAGTPQPRRSGIPIAGPSTPSRLGQSMTPGSAASNPVTIDSSSTNTRESLQAPLDNEDEESEVSGGNRSTQSDEVVLQDHPVLLALGQDPAHVHESVWERVCRFFRCDTDTRELKIDGLKLKLKDYQLLVIWSILTQVPVRKSNSFMLGDGPGLGKTAMSLSTMTIFARLHIRQRAIEAEWDDKDRTLGRKVARAHLPRNKQRAGDQCPSQPPNDVVCPCVEGSDSRLIVEQLASLPSIVVASPEVLAEWEEEAAKWLDFNGSPRQPSRTDALSDTEASARDIIFVSPHGAMRLYDSYTEKFTVPRNREDLAEFSGKPYTISRLGTTFVFFDECQKYYGTTSDRFTLPFDMLGRLRESALTPVVAVGVSGSLRGIGPAAWRPFIRHHFNSIDKWEGLIAAEFEGLRSLDDLPSLIAHWDFLEKNLDSIEEKRTETAKARFAQLRPFLEDFIPIMLMARKGEDIFRGHRLLPFNLGKLQILKCPMPQGASRQAFVELAKEVASWTGKLFEAHYQTWVKNGRRGEKPDKKKFETERLEHIASLNNPGHESFHTIIRAAEYPAVARLVFSEEVPRKYTITEELTRLSRQLTTRNIARHEIHTELQESPWWPHAEELEAESPKFNALCNIVDQMIAAKNQVVDDEIYGPLAPDGTNVRHMIIFSSTPLAAYLTHMLLFRKYPNVDLFYVHSGLSQEQKALMIKNMKADCRARSKNKIMIATFELAGAGINLQRCNYLVMTSFPTTVDVQQQAYSRVDRQGQTQRMFIYQLIDQDNLAEMIRYSRAQNRLKLSEVGHNEGRDDAGSDAANAIELSSDTSNSSGTSWHMEDFIK
ncbi:hypothetical protein F4778DRAFT_799851 [Xylariomycetidae sp. FL2044]|nr:hypothetical protein F4778DRAFT_799851 [Xylariomycetidae sp. FL2044]